MNNFMQLARHHNLNTGRAYAETDRSWHTASLTSRAPLADRVNLYRLRIDDDTACRDFSFTAGQFIMLELPGIGEAPFSIASNPAQGGQLELCIREVGTLTAFLSRIAPATRLGVSGPYGNGFPLTEMAGCDLLLVAGGLGLAALRSSMMTVVGNRSRYGRVSLLHGAGSPSGLLLQEEHPLYRSAGIEVECVVDRPDACWQGKTGTVCTLLNQRRDELERKRTTTMALVCGPPVMFVAVCDLLVAAGLPPHHIFVSLERRMHCGRGKCCRCNIGSTYTCLDGPVFSYWSVMNLKEAI